MTRIYENRALPKRMNISAVVAAGAGLWGCYELYVGLTGGEGAGTSLVFSLLFIGGAIYAAKQILDMTANSVVAIDADPSRGDAIISLWRPFSTRSIKGTLAQLTDWQFQVSGKARTPILTVHHPLHPQPLELELGSGITISDEVRALAPEAVATYERR